MRLRIEGKCLYAWACFSLSQNHSANYRHLHAVRFENEDILTRLGQVMLKDMRLGQKAKTSALPHQISFDDMDP